MDRNGYPVEIAIGLLVMAAFLYFYLQVPAASVAAPRPVATTQAR